MITVGNIITKESITGIPNNFDIHETVLTTDTPNLIIGWELTKTLCPEASILRKKIKDNLYWTFSPTEKRSVFENDLKKYIDKSYKDCIDLIELKDNKNYDFSKTLKRNTIVLISPQLISASSNNEDITNFEEKLKSLKEAYNIQAENIFVDEAHNYFTPQWEKYYESILKGGQIILASGTSANLILKHQDKFDETNTFIWGIKELKTKLLQELNIDLKLEVKLIQLKNTNGSDFNISNLQSEDDGVLSNQYHFEEIVNKMIDPNSKFSPIFSRERKHHILLLDTVYAAKEFKRIVQSSKYSDKIVPILVAGSNGRDANSEEEVNKLILEAESQGKRTITLTCGSMIQGVSERNWKSILNLSSKSTYEIYFQLFGRGFEFDNDLDTHIGKKTKTERVIMWDYNPHRIYSVGAEFVDAIAKINGENQQQALKYFYEIIDITEYVEEGRTWSKVKTYEEIEYKINEIVNKNTIRRGLTVNTCLDKTFGIDQLDSEWIEWAIKQKWSTTGKSGDKLRKEKLDIWQQNLNKQKTDHSKSQKNKIEKQIQKEVLDLKEEIKKSFEQTLSKLDIVWAVYKSQGKVDYHIDELFKYYEENAFLNGLGLPNKSISKVFIKTVKRFGLIDKINGKLKDSRIEKIENFLNMDRKTFINASNNGIDKWFNKGYNGDNTQLSVEKWIFVLEDWVKKLQLTELKNFNFPYVKSGSGIIALTYLLYENSIKIFGKQLTKEEVIKSVSFEDKNTFFESLVSTMGFIKSNNSKKDFIVINPPYKRGKHLEIFNKAFEELNDGGTLICIHPSVQFLNAKPTDDTNTLLTRNIVSTYKTQLKFVNGNDIFNAGFFTPLSITTVQKIKNPQIEVIYSHIDSLNNKINVYNNLDDIFIHANDIVLSIKNRLLSKSYESVSKHLYRTGCIGETYIKFNILAGNKPKNGKLNPDFYCLIYKDFENKLESVITTTPNGKKENGGAINELALSKPEYSKNAFEYLKTKFVRFCLSLRKTGGDINLVDMEFIPYLDFSKEWTDEKLFEHFDFNDDEIKFVNEYIPNWYERDVK